MRNDTTIRTVLLLEVAGFFVLTLAIWFDELLDLPHYFFGAPLIHINYEEALFESAFVLAMAVAVMLLTRRLLGRIRQLEQLLPICMFCKRIRKPGTDPEQQESWETVERYVHDRTGVQFSHGFCPECGMKHYGEVLRET
jgi:hypothetical protein